MSKNAILPQNSAESGLTEPLREIVVALREAGLGQEARQIFREALRATQRLWDFDRPWILSEIAQAQAEAGLYAEALQTAQKIIYDSARDEALKGIVAAQVEAGLYAEALQTAQGIKSDTSRDEALKGIAVAQAEAGFYAEALQTAQGIKSNASRAEALILIAESQIRAGRRNDARQTLQQALEIAREIENAFERAMVLTRTALVLLEEPEEDTE